MREASDEPVNRLLQHRPARQRQAGRPPAHQQDHQHGGLGQHLHPHRLHRQRARPDRAGAGRQPRRRIRGPGGCDAAVAGTAAGPGDGPGHRDSLAVARGLEGEHAQLAFRREFQPLLPGSAGRPAARAAGRLPDARAVPDGGRGDRYALGWPQRLVPALLAHARGRGPGAAQGDARGHGSLVHRLALPLYRCEWQRAAARGGREPGQAGDHHRTRRRWPYAGADSPAGLERAQQCAAPCGRAEGRGADPRLARPASCRHH